MVELAWLIPVLPLIGFLINGLGNKNIPKGLVGIIGSATVLGAFIISLMIFFQLKADPSQAPYIVNLFEWFSVGTLKN